MLPFHHPSTTLVLDDDALFLESFAYSYGRNLLCKTVSFPQTAVDIVLADADRLSGSLNVIAPFFFDEVDGSLKSDQSRMLRLRSNPLAALADDANRTSTISVVVVDFAMPSMSGLDVCRRIKGCPAKKILLTGKTGDQTAVAAFNEGLIDCFLVKQDPDLPERLPREICRLEGEFFAAISAPVSIAAQASDLRFLGDPVLCRFLEAEFERERIQQYFLWSDPPGFLAIDSAGHRRHFVIYGAEAMRAQYEIAAEMGAPSELVGALRAGGTIASFPTATGFYNEEFSESWMRFAADARAVPGTQWHVAAIDVALAS